MIKDIKELNFPAYATLETATATISDMGDRTITSQVKIDGDVVPDFSYDWEVEFKGERYIHPVKTPQGTKDNTSRKSNVDLAFQHWAIYEMKRQYFVEMASTTADTAIADKYIASLGLNLGDFVVAFNLVLNHYFDGRIVIRLNPEWQYDAEAQFVSISYSYIWDVLQQMHEIYGVRWTLKTNADGVCEILMGYPAEEISHIFEYGFEGGLLSVQRQVQSTDIRNRLLGRGGSKNLPHRYFKDKDPNNPLFEADPDWIPELANITFTELRGKTFRDYVRGWKAKRYGGTPMAEPTDAYLAGYNAEKFDPIEYVDDKESIEKYGVLIGALENNEGIYPSIQGAPGDVDMIVDAEQVTDDDVDSAVENDSVTTNLESGHQTYRNAPANSTITIETLTKHYFSVPAGKVGSLDMSLTVTGKYSNVGDYEPTYPILKDGTVKITIYDKNTDAIITSSTVPVINIPAGDYYYMISAEVETNYDKTSMVTLNIESVHLYTSTPDESEGWRPTFDIWVRNIWGSSREAGETDQQYADRVWLPILGDRMGDEARVVFASGWLSFSSDWEFPIVGYAFDDSKPDSHWRLTLAKSEAELEASGKYIPYEGYNASAGDRFFFIGIDMPWQYVYWGEERIDDDKRGRLPETARINPSWVIKTDRVRLNQNRNGAKLINSLGVGSQIRLASKQFISGAYESLYVQSMTYNWTSDTILYPDVEVVVSDKVAAVKNPVAQIQGNIETLQRQMGSLSNIRQIIRQVCDQLYLRKDGVEDLSKSPTRFLGKVTGEKFRQGQIGGRDWGIYRDENGNAILEADKLVARQGILVNDLVVNEATYVGGLQINSAAAMKVTAVEETEDGYICYFDQQQGSVTNKFKIDDIALCQKFDSENNEVKFYKRRVVAVAETSVTLSKTDVNGDGIPAVDDEIIHYGNYTDKTRQFVIIRDVIGGGYERMLMGLDSVTSEGVEYYFAGKSADSKARWFVGDAEQYAKYEDGQLTIKGNLFVTGGDKPINELIKYITDALGSGDQGLILGTAIIVGYNDDEGNFIPMAGLSGKFNKDQENGGPAAWYGGTPEDARSMIFMDGTGYFASGLFKWDREKGINLGDGSIWINYDGTVEFGENIKISTEGDETLGTILTFMAKFNNMFYLTEDGQSIGTALNFFSEKEVSANGLHLGSGSGSGSGGSSTLAGLIDVDLSSPVSGNILVFNGTHWVNKPQSELVPDIDLSDYYTRTEVDAKLGAYIKTTDADAKYAPLAGFNTLKSDFDALNKALNDDVSGKINTWNEIVDFVDEYSGSEDLATIISGINAEVNKRLLISTYEIFLSDEYNPLKTKVGGIEGKVTDLEQFEQTTNSILGDLQDRDDKRLEAINANTAAISALKARGIIAGKGLLGGGTLAADITLNIETANDGISVNEDSIQLNTVDDLTTASATKPLSASQGKALSERIAVFEKMFAFVDGNIKTTFNLWSTQEISANGLHLGSGGGGGGLISTVLGVSDLGSSLAENNTVVFNAHATNTIYNDLVTLKGRVDNLAVSSSNVSWNGDITSGKQIGTLTVNGLENHLFAPATYSWEEVSGKTSAKLITLLGYTPYNAANFTKANIKSTLGISDWALASSKPSYTTSDVTEGNRLYFTNARAVSAVLGSSAIGSTTAYPYWTGSAWATKTLPTKLSQFTDDIGILTDDALDGYATVTFVTNQGYATQTWVTNKGYATKSDIPTSLKNPYSLTFGEKTYNGSAAKTITASDLGALTSHQSIYALTIKNSAGTTQVTYTPNSQAASLTLTKAMIGLGSVENTALSTWTGSSNITTLGTITSGTWKGTAIANTYLANSKVTIAGTDVSLGGSISASTIKTAIMGSTALGGNSSYIYWSGTSWGVKSLGTLAFKSSLSVSDIPSLDYLSTNGGTVNGALTVAGTLAPDANGTRNLGTSTKSWKNCYTTAMIIASSATLSWDGSALKVNQPFYSTGEISANGLYTSSDIRFKNRIADVLLDIDTIANAPMFRFTWIDGDGKEHIGTSAQYWRGTDARELVTIGNNDLHRLDYATLGVLMGKSLALEIRGLKREIVKLKEEKRRMKYGN